MKYIFLVILRRKGKKNEAPVTKDFTSIKVGANEYHPPADDSFFLCGEKWRPGSHGVSQEVRKVILVADPFTEI